MSAHSKFPGSGGIRQTFNQHPTGARLRLKQLSTRQFSFTDGYRTTRFCGS